MSEVSIRLAVGASSSDVLRMLVRDALRPVLIGLLAGLGAAVLAGRVVVRELGGLSPRDPLALTAAVRVLLLCALAAVIVPARRASRTDPASLLRES
jgi:putative ABC transport system permease protein